MTCLIIMLSLRFWVWIYKSIISVEICDEGKNNQLIFVIVFVSFPLRAQLVLQKNPDQWTWPSPNVLNATPIRPCIQCTHRQMELLGSISHSEFRLESLLAVKLGLVSFKSCVCNQQKRKPLTRGDGTQPKSSPANLQRHEADLSSNALWKTVATKTYL